MRFFCLGFWLRFEVGFDCGTGRVAGVGGDPAD
jgi:hypothetical protein